MNPRARLSVGGTLIPEKHLYIVRREDVEVYRLLRECEYVNILTSRQMGKSSLVMQTIRRLVHQEGDAGPVRTAYVDLAAKLGNIGDRDTYYQGLLTAIADKLELSFNVQKFWGERAAETPNQRLMRFFSDVVSVEFIEPIVIFLDEVDSTLSRPFADDLFTAIRGMYNERPLVEAYQRIAFCLIGVATPNELIKDRRTTPYNVGHTIELRDFDLSQDDLSPLAGVMGSDPALASEVLARIIDWTGGHPYLTTKLCAEMAGANCRSASAVDEHIEESFRSLEQVGSEVHFQQIQRFLSTRVSDALATFDLYARLLNGERVRQQTTTAHLDLKLSGLVTSDADGHLVIRNRIYRRLFDEQWAADKLRRSTLAAPEVARTRRRAGIATAAAVLLAVFLTWWFSDAERRLVTRYTVGLYKFVEPSMIDIRGGRFLMGSSYRDDAAFGDETRPREVAVTPFRVGKYEVTFEEYDYFALATDRGLPFDVGWGRGRRPVVNVAWEDALAYAEWLSAKTGKQYRLPTEAEWEYVARAGKRTTYWWGNDIRENGEVWANCDGCGSQWDNKSTAPVGKFPANPFGLFDTAGNAWERVSDCWHDSYQDAPDDGSAWLEADGGDCDRRVIRGGSWYFEPETLRSASRDWFYRFNAYNYIGFRLAQDLPD